MSAAEHLREAIAVGCTRDDHDHVAMLRAEILAEAADELDAVCEQYGVLGVGDRLRRMAGEKDSTTVPTSTHPTPLVVSRFDTAMEPAIEEEPLLTIGCIAEDGTPVALLLDPETRAKVGRWLLPEKDVDERLGRLADHILNTGGEWTTGKTHAWLAAEVDPDVSRCRARHALQHLTALGYLIERDRKGRRAYTPNYAKADTE